MGSALNAAGVSGGFVYQDGKFRKIIVPNAASSGAVSINSQGDITGGASTASGKTELFLGKNCR